MSTVTVIDQGESAVIPGDLPTIAAEINRHHQLCLDALNAGLDHARQAGQLLVRAKRQVGHGEWGEWLDAHFAGSRRSAQLYMRVAKRWPAIEAKAQGLAHLGLEAAGRLLASPQPEPEPVDQTPVDWFVDEGLLNEEHAHELRQVKNIIGVEPVIQFRVVDLPIARTPEDAAAVLYRLGPESRSPFYKPSDAVQALINRFFAYSNAKGGNVPNWERIAFWWGCLAVDTDVRAGQLARAIDRWVERFYSAVVFITIYGEGPPTAGDDDDRAIDRRAWYWGSRADLHHAAMLDYSNFDSEAGAALNMRAMDATKGELFAPSEVNDLLRRYDNDDERLTPEQKQTAKAIRRVMQEGNDQ